MAGCQSRSVAIGRARWRGKLVFGRLPGTADRGPGRGSTAAGRPHTKSSTPLREFDGARPPAWYSTPNAAVLFIIRNYVAGHSFPVGVCDGRTAWLARRLRTAREVSCAEQFGLCWRAPGLWRQCCCFRDRPRVLRPRLLCRCLPRPLLPRGRRLPARLIRQRVPCRHPCRICRGAPGWSTATRSTLAVSRCVFMAWMRLKGPRLVSPTGSNGHVVDRRRRRLPG